MTAALSLVPGAVWLAADQLLKAWCSSHVRLWKRVPILGQDVLVLTHALNRGVAFDAFSGRADGAIDPYTRYGPSAIWLALLAAAIARFRRASRVERVAWGLLLGAGASNLADHWRRTSVVDTLQLYLNAHEHVPFNLADVGVLAAGVALVALLGRELAPRAGRASVR